VPTKQGQSKRRIRYQGNLDRLMAQMANRAICFGAIRVMVADEASRRGGRQQHRQKHRNGSKPNWSWGTHQSDIITVAFVDRIADVAGLQWVVL
jgi:hypothetical protein